MEKIFGSWDSGSDFGRTRPSFGRSTGTRTSLVPIVTAPNSRPPIGESARYGSIPVGGRIGRQGEIRDHSSEGQHYRMAGLNLLTAIVIYWNTAHLGEAIRHRKHADLTVEPEFLAHISPLGWAHILLTGENRWPKRR